MNGVGSLEVVRFLHDHRTEGCTTDAMDSAAALGRLDIVRILHEQRTEGCTTNSMDEATAEGHLDVVRFLHEHRSEGCTTGAMGKAAERGHLEIVQFLHANRTEDCGQSHLVHLLTIGAFDVWLAMQERFPDNDSAKEAMREAGTELVLPTIRFLCEKMGRYDLFPHAFEYIRHESVEWIHALSPFIQACDKKRDTIEQLIGQAVEAEPNHIFSIRCGTLRQRTSGFRNSTGAARAKGNHCVESGTVGGISERVLLFHVVSNQFATCSRLGFPGIHRQEQSLCV